jgi:16S rRNA (cytosine1402-N4)-methyltransferase
MNPEEIPTNHVPVFPNEILDFFSKIQKPNPIFLDGTAGEGGHSLLILEKFTDARLVLVDRDFRMLERAIKRLERFSDRVIPICSNFSEINQTILQENKITKLDGILLDLGISTFHIQNSGRGFSFQRDEPLDMRLSENATTDAKEILNHSSKKKLEEIFLQYGEENWSRKIANKVVEIRKKSPFETTEDLKKAVEMSIPRKFWPPRVHPSFRIFQALRIAVNEELSHIEKGIPLLAKNLAPEGIFCVISFHSLEDRIVKNTFKELGRENEFGILTKKPIVPTDGEIGSNPASRSAKLRVLQAI